MSKKKYMNVDKDIKAKMLYEEINTALQPILDKYNIVTIIAFRRDINLGNTMCAVNNRNLGWHSPDELIELFNFSIKELQKHKNYLEEDEKLQIIN